MQVLLDGSAVTIERPTIRSALDAARAAASSRGRVIVEARIDGHPLGEEELAAPSDQELLGASLDFITAEPASLVRVTLLELVPLLDEARACQQTAADHVSSGKLPEAFESLTRAFEVWEGVRQAVGNGSELLGIELDAVSVSHNGRSCTLAQCAESLAQDLSEVKRSLSAQDLPGLSDVLSYELDEQTGLWQAALRSLAEHAASSYKQPITPPRSNN